MSSCRPLQVLRVLLRLLLLLMMSTTTTQPLRSREAERRLQDRRDSTNKKACEEQQPQETKSSDMAPVRVKSPVFGKQPLVFWWVPPYGRELLFLRQSFVQSINHLEDYHSSRNRGTEAAWFVVTGHLGTRARSRGGQCLTSFWMAFDRAASETIPRTIFTSRPSRLTRTPAGRPPSNPNLTAVSLLHSMTG